MKLNTQRRSAENDSSQPTELEFQCIDDALCFCSTSRIVKFVASHGAEIAQPCKKRNAEIAYRAVRKM